jgi:hypothetical protein
MDNLTQNAEPQSSNPKPKRGCLKPVLLTLFALLLLLHFITPIIAGRIANAELPKALNTEASLGSISLNLLLGRSALHDLTIAQPASFEGDALVTLGELSFSASSRSALRRKPIIVRHLRVEDLSLNLISNAEGVLNISRIGPTPAAASEAPEALSEPATPAPPPAIWVQQILLENVDLAFRDLAKNWQISLEDLHFEIEDLRISGNPGEAPATFRAEVKIISPASRVPASVLMIGRIGTLHPDRPESAPPIRFALGLFGFDLAAIDPFLAPAPAAAKATLGGSGIDFTLFFDLAEGPLLAEQPIRGRYDLTTDGGRSYRGTLGGTPDKPILPFMNIFSNLLGTQLGRLSDLGGNVAQGALSAAEGVADTGVAAVKGAANAVKGLGVGLFDAAKGVVTLDSEAALGGIKDATVGTVGNVADTVKDTAVAAGGAVSETFDTVRGSDDVKKWWEDPAPRRAAFEAEAGKWLDEP